MGVGMAVATGAVGAFRHFRDRALASESDAAGIVIFGEDGRYWQGIFRPICDEFESRGIDVTYFTFNDEDKALKMSYEHVSCELLPKGARGWAKLNRVSSDVLLSSTPGLDVLQWRRSPYVKRYVHIPHSVDTIAT
jgi:hypothetical protein